MINTLKKTFYISSHKLGLNLSGIQHEYQYNGVYLGFYSDEYKPELDKASIALSFEDFCVLPEGVIPECNYVSINRESLTVVGSAMNTQAIYYISRPEEGIFVVFNDLMIAKNVLQGLGIEVEYDANMDEDLTFFRHVNRLKFSEKLIVSSQNGKMTVQKYYLEDILKQERCNYTLTEAKEKFYQVLFNSTKKLTEGIDEVYISLSGGIDSGTIAYILKKLGKNICAYTLGTDWGNEYREAQETEDFLGIDLKKIHFSKEEIVEEVPNIIRYFGFKNSITIEIALVAFHLYKKLNNELGKPMNFVTGYGSDLLNAGIYPKFNHYSELEKELLLGLGRTQISNEFSNLAAANMDVKAIHPFWHSDVIREALRIPVEFKVVDGKDKYFFRSLMDGRYPSSIAWRSKKGAHQGTGLTACLKGEMESIYAREGANGADYNSILNDIHKDIFLNGKYPWKSKAGF